MTMMNKFVISLSLMMVSVLLIVWVLADHGWIHTRWNYDDSEYHYIAWEAWKLDLEIRAYEHEVETQLADHEQFARKMINFWRQHSERLYYGENGRH